MSKNNEVKQVIYWLNTVTPLSTKALLDPETRRFVVNIAKQKEGHMYSKIQAIKLLQDYAPECLI